MTTNTLKPRLVWVMAATAGLAAANLYYAQPLLDSIARSLKVAPAEVGLVVTLTQLGYAAGLVLVVPLGDLFERRRLIITVLLLTALALLGVGFSPNLPLLTAFSFLVGLSSVAAQIVLPLAASLAGDENRGRVVGTVTGGLLFGILGARVFSGLVADVGSWRAVYFLAAAAMVALALLLRFELPRFEPSPDTTGSSLRYPELLRSIGRLVREEPILRRRSLYGLLGFACFCVMWTTLTFHLAAAPFALSDTAIGMFGLIGAAGALVAAPAGRLTDRGHGRALTFGSMVLLAASFGILALGRTQIALVIIGVLLLDLAVQALRLADQSVVFALRPEARSRLNSVYMTTYFLGGALGTFSSAWVFDHHGFIASCGLGAGFALLALVLFATEPQKRGANGR